MKNVYTENLADFGIRERAIAAKLLAQPLPEGFNEYGVRLAFNRNSGFVFLVNDEFQCAMLNCDSLEIFHTTPYDGKEGFLCDLLALEPSEYEYDDREYIRQAAKNEGVELPNNWNVDHDH